MARADGGYVTASRDASRRGADGPDAQIICPRFPFPPVAGGVKRTLRLAECMERAGLRVVLLSDDDPSPRALCAAWKRGWGTTIAGPPSSPMFTRLHQHLARLPAPRSSQLEASLRAPPVGRRALAQAEGIVATAHLRLPLQVPVVFSTHNVDSELAGMTARERPRLDSDGARLRYHAYRVARAETRFAKGADAVICVSEHDAEHFARLASNIVLAPNGVDPEFFSVGPVGLEREEVLFFGQFTYAPNLDGLGRFLTEGWPELARLRPSCRLLVAGDGSRELVRPSGPAADRVEVLGLVDDIAATVARARLTVVPIWSGGGTRLKVLESLAAGRPVVGTSLGVSGVGFRDRTHGLEGDTPLELALACAALLEEPARARVMAAHGRRLACAYAWEKALAPAEELYRRYAAKVRGT